MVLNSECCQLKKIKYFFHRFFTFKVAYKPINYMYEAHFLLNPNKRRIYRQLLKYGSKCFRKQNSNKNSHLENVHTFHRKIGISVKRRYYSGQMKIRIRLNCRLVYSRKQCIQIVLHSESANCFCNRPKKTFLYFDD